MQEGESMFGPNHYVPILRWKRGERFALGGLAEEDRSVITPLVEMTPKMFDAYKQGKKKGSRPEPAQVLFDTAKGHLKDWGYSPFFIDFWHVDGQIPSFVNKKRPLEYLAEEARGMRLALVPVTALDRREEYQLAVARVASFDGRGVCIRLCPEDVLAENFVSVLGSLLRRMNLKIGEVHLLLDCQVFNPEQPVTSLLNRIPNLPDWRTLTIASGAFPKDLQDYEPGMARISGSDWLTWSRIISEEKRPSRKPSFSDYTIQYGRYVEPPDNCNPSASIRYTLPQQWLVLRGEGIMNKKGPGRAQWPANATLLCDSPEFYGPDFSAGDDYIYKVSNGTESHGSPETWIRAGINHHMTLVSRQLASLAGS
jgi:hypothetical protein